MTQGDALAAAVAALDSVFARVEPGDEKSPLGPAWRVTPSLDMDLFEEFAAARLVRFIGEPQTRPGIPSGAVGLVYEKDGEYYPSWKSLQSLVFPVPRRSCERASMHGWAEYDKLVDDYISVYVNLEVRSRPPGVQIVAVFRYRYGYGVRQYKVVQSPAGDDGCVLFCHHMRTGGEPSNGLIDWLQEHAPCPPLCVTRKKSKP